MATKRDRQLQTLDSVAVELEELLDVPFRVNRQGRHLEVNEKRVRPHQQKLAHKIGHLKIRASKSSQTPIPDWPDSLVLRPHRGKWQVRMDLEGFAHLVTLLSVSFD